MLPKKVKKNVDDIYFAIQHQSIEDLKKILEDPESEVDVTDEYRYQTALHEAVSLCWPEGVQLLLQQPDININYRENNRGETPLYRLLAYVSFYPDHLSRLVLELLLNAEGIDVNTAGDAGDTPLSIAIASENMDAAKRILKHPHVQYDPAEIPPHLLDNQTNLDLTLKTATDLEMLLHSAVRAGDVSLVTLLLEEKGVDPCCLDENGNTPLHIAMRENQHEIVQCLLQHQKGAESIGRRNAVGETPLHVGLKYQATKACLVLLNSEHLNKYSAQLNLPDDSGKTLLHCAVYSDRNFEIIPLIFEKTKIEADAFNAQDKRGFTPFYFAIYSDSNVDGCHKNAAHKIAQKLLLDERMDLTTVDAADHDYAGQTPFHWAAKTGNLEVLRILIEKNKTDINAKTSRTQETPLLLAAHNAVRAPEFFSTLFTTPGVNVNITNRAGSSPLGCMLDALKRNPSSKKAIRFFEQNANVLFSDKRIVLQSLEKLLYGGLELDNLVIFTCLINHLKNADALMAFPDPEDVLSIFLLHLNEMEIVSPRISAYYIALNALKRKSRVAHDKIFQAHQELVGEYSQIAFYEAQCALGLVHKDVFAQVVFLSDGLLRLRDLKENKDLDIEEALALRVQRFFRMVNGLPLELQMQTCYAIDGNPKQLIPSIESEPAFRSLALKLEI